jgi:hypothetical protein
MNIERFQQSMGVEKESLVERGSVSKNSEDWANTVLLTQKEVNAVAAYAAGLRMRFELGGVYSDEAKQEKNDLDRVVGILKDARPYKVGMAKLKVQSL